MEAHLALHRHIFKSVIPGADPTKPPTVLPGTELYERLSDLIDAVFSIVESYYPSPGPETEEELAHRSRRIANIAKILLIEKLQVLKAAWASREK